MRNALATVGHMVIAVAIAAAVSVISLSAIGRVQWPAFPSSNQLHALTTVGQVGCIVGLLCAGWVWRRGKGRTLARLLALVFVSAFSVVTLGMPLGATKLYLFGISVDQQFRTEYLTRLTDSSSLHDMTYAGLPAFYPPGWFWVGGRIAALTGTPAWETFKPWAITSITIAIAVALVLWWRLVRFEYAVIVTAATAAVTLAYSSPEPYSAMITVLLPPVLILTWSGLRARERHAGVTETAERHAGVMLEPDATRSGGWAAVIGAGIFLGVAATCYTLLLAYSAFTVLLMAVALAAARRRDGLKAALDPLLRLAVIGVITAAIASTTWLPFLLRAAHDPVSNTGSAYHYLPADGAELAFPMLKFTLLGALCLLGTLWLVVRARSSVRAGGLCVVAAVDARHVGAHHAAVLPVAAHPHGVADRRGRLRLHRRHSSFSRAWARSCLGPGPAAGGGVDRLGRGDRLQPGHPRRAATRPHHRLHRHRRPRATRRPPAAELGEVLSGDRHRDHPGNRQTAGPDGGHDRRLQLPVLLPLLRLPRADVALRQPARPVRQARGGDQGLVQAQSRRSVHPRAGHPAVGAADGLPDAARRLGG